MSSMMIVAGGGGGGGGGNSQSISRGIDSLHSAYSVQSVRNGADSKRLC